MPNQQQEKPQSNIVNYKQYQRDYHKRMRREYYINMYTLLSIELTKLDECPHTKQIIKKLIAKYERQINK